MVKALKKEEILGFMKEVCSSWVNQLNLNIDEVGEMSVSFTWQAGDDLCREVAEGDKIVSGQATMAVADTVSFLTICALHNELTNCTTVDMGTNFMRPIFAGDITVLATALSMGRKLVTIRIEFMQKGKLAASSTGVFAYL
jgi:uncharacterized protein (TIGR00369 family)